MDFLLSVAAGQAASERCQLCNGPIYLCHDPDRDIDYATTEDICYVSRAREKREEAARGKDGKGDTSGMHFGAEPYSRTGKPLGSFREPYWRGVMEKREVLVASRLPEQPPQ